MNGGGVTSLGQHSDAVAHATATLANSTSALVASVHRTPGAKVRAASVKSKAHKGTKRRALAFRGSYRKR